MYDENLTEGEGDADFTAAFDEFAGGTADTPPNEGREEEGGDEGGQSAAGNEGQAASDTNPGSDAGGEQQGQEQTPDIWANAPAEARAAYEAAQRDLVALQHYKRSNEGRVAAFQRRIAELEQAAPKPAQGQQQTGAENAPAYLQSEEFKRFQEDYPEVAGPIAAILQAQAQQIENLNQTFSGLSQEQQERVLAEQETLLAGQHPDWLEVTSSPSFGEWVAKQPRFVQEGIVRNGHGIVDGDEAARILSLYKADTGATQLPATGGKSTIEARRKRQLQSATSVPSRGPGAASGPPDDFEAAFNHYATRK